MMRVPAAPALPGGPGFALADLNADMDADPALAMADPGPDSRIAVIGPGALDVMCRVMRLGCRSAILLKLGERPVPPEADIVIIPEGMGADRLMVAIPFARRMLAPMGMLVLRLPPERPDALVVWARRQLKLHGFTAVRVRTERGDTLIGAEVPMQGGRVSCV